MTDIAIRVENLGKRYRIGVGKERHDTLRDAVAHGIRSRLRRDGRRSEEQDLWALRDVSFEVKRGEVIGVIGRNGAGKSTLLKILSRITEPTTGRVELRGRVGSLLEVGTGFHPELTGRENIYLNGAILGMRKAEIDRRFDEIVAFSEIERFLDTPVKRYSSGMYVRLAFAVAAHLEPEILLVDEVLAVGDAAFQKKCLGKMGEVGKEGRTVVFVSHNMAAVEALCANAVLLQDGLVIHRGRSREIVRSYVEQTSSSALTWQRGQAPQGAAHIQRVSIEGRNGSQLASLDTLTVFDVVIDFALNRALQDLRLTVGMLGPHGENVFDAQPEDNGQSAPSQPGEYRARVSFQPGILLPTHYCVKVGLWRTQDGVIDAHVGPSFSVEEAAGPAGYRSGGRAGLLLVRSCWRISERDGGKVGRSAG